MRIAITGGTGFVGRHVARMLGSGGHTVVLVARGVDTTERRIRAEPWVRWCPASLNDVVALEAAFAGCDAVAHCAGINRELGSQSFQRVHVDGTGAVVQAADRAGVARVALLSFLRARPACGSPYHETKWAAEEVVRGRDGGWTVVKPGIIYGRGDHLLDHLSHALHTIPVFPLPGRRCRVAPVHVDDIARVVSTAVTTGRLEGKTLPVVGPEVLAFGELVRRVADAIERPVALVPTPLVLHRAAAAGFEAAMRVPLMSRAQARILAESVVEPVLAPDPMPADLVPNIRLTAEVIRDGISERGPFRFSDLRWCSAR